MVTFHADNVVLRRQRRAGGQKLIQRRTPPFSSFSKASASDIWVRWCKDIDAIDHSGDIDDPVPGAPLGAEDCLRQVLANAPKLQVDG